MYFPFDCIIFENQCIQDNKSAEIKYGALKAAFKQLINTFGAKVLDHFQTDDDLKPGQAATQVGVLMHHFRRITKDQEKLDAATAILSTDLRQDFQDIFEFCRGSSSKSPKAKRTLKATLSEVSVDSAGFPKIPDSPGLKMDAYGFPMAPFL